MNITYREAGKGDAPLIVEFIRAIADYEKLSDEVKVTDADIDRWVFEENLVNVIFAQVDGKDVGFALYFYNFSTFTVSQDCISRTCLCILNGVATAWVSGC